MKKHRTSAQWQALVDQHHASGLSAVQFCKEQSVGYASFCNGQYFVFINRRKTQLKMLYFTPTGFCVWAKRLEQGQFRIKPSTSGQRALTFTDLQLLIDGIEVQKYRQFKRYQSAS